MNSRRARRLATTRLAAVARLLSSQADQLDELTPADKLRMKRAYHDLAHELDVRAGLLPRAARLVPVDPGQVPLFQLKREDADRGVHREGAERQ